MWITRKLPDGRYGIAGFLVDVNCLGVKNALFNISTEKEYSHLMGNIYPDNGDGSVFEPLEYWHPSCARKLLEQARAYAKGIGFKPHVDYAIARMILHDIDASACRKSFTFGRNGKPFYRSGPNDSPAMQQRIIKQLERHCGPFGYEASVSIPDSMDAFF